MIKDTNLKVQVTMLKEDNAILKQIAKAKKLQLVNFVKGIF